MILLGVLAVLIFQKSLGESGIRKSLILSKLIASEKHSCLKDETDLVIELSCHTLIKFFILMIEFRVSDWRILESGD